MLTSPGLRHRPRYSRKIRLTLWGVFTVALAIFLTVNVIHQYKKAMQTHAVSNCRQLDICLMEFRSQYGKFPDESTIALVREKSGSQLPLGTRYSNDFFRQLIASGVATSEPMFYANTVGTHEPDGNMSGAEAIKKGECGYVYLMGAKFGDNPSRPLICAPMVPGTDHFDAELYEGKAVFLQLDGFVTYLPIDKDGHAIWAGQNIMDPRNPLWDGHPPDVVFPDL